MVDFSVDSGYLNRLQCIKYLALNRFKQPYLAICIVCLRIYDCYLDGLQCIKDITKVEQINNRGYYYFLSQRPNSAFYFGQQNLFYRYLIYILYKESKVGHPYASFAQLQQCIQAKILIQGFILSIKELLTFIGRVGDLGFYFKKIRVFKVSLYLYISEPQSNWSLRIATPQKLAGGQKSISALGIPRFNRLSHNQLCPRI